MSRKKEIAWHTENRRYNFLRIWDKRYFHMKARHEGRASHYSHCEGKGLLSHEEFILWCKNFDNLNVFLAIYFDWASNGFNRWDSPSIDRIDSTKGYTADNIQWLSFANNCEKNHKDPITHQEMVGT